MKRATPKSPFVLSLFVLAACQQAYSIRVGERPADSPLPAAESAPSELPADSGSRTGEDARPSPEPQQTRVPEPGPSAEPSPAAVPVPSPSVSPSASPVAEEERQVVCDPLEGPGGSKSARNKERGLKGKIFVLDPSQPRFEDSRDYLSHGRELPLDLYMHDVAVEPRYFREGFKTGRGDLLRTLKGERLLEHFGIRLESNVVLGPKDAPGLYEFAVLSDDGATLQLMQSEISAGEVLLSFEGAHAPGLGCAGRAVELGPDTRLPIRLSYFQGPRYQLALMLLWRKVDDGHGRRAAEPLCGKFRNDLFFKVTPNASVPQKAYRNLLERGWRLLRPENFLLGEGKNRC